MILFSLLFCIFAQAEDAKNFYDLQNLKPMGFSQYNEANLSRMYLHFQNELGHHYIVYEDAPQLANLKDIYVLRELMGGSENTCALEIQCASKAFCTGGCANMYYEFTNAPSIAADRNRCTLKAYSCEKNSDSRMPSSIALPSEAPASFPVAPSPSPGQIPAPAKAPAPVNTGFSDLSALKENVKKLEADPMAGHNLEE